MKISFKRFLSASLAAVMLLLMIPAGLFTAFAEEMTVVNMFIGPEPSERTAEQQSWERFDTLYDAEAYYDWTTSYSASSQRYHYVCHVTGDITETQDWGDNIRRTVTVKALNPDTKTIENNPTITISVTPAIKSAWFLTGGNEDGNATFENINITMSATGAHYDITNEASRSIFGVSGFTSLTLNNVVLTKDASSAQYMIRMREDVAGEVIFKGTCKFWQLSGSTLVPEPMLIGGFTQRTSGAESYTVTFDGATIDMGSANLLDISHYNSISGSFDEMGTNTPITVNIKNGSVLSTDKYLLRNYSASKVTVNMSGSTTNVTGAGKHFHSRGNSSEIELNITDSLMTTTNGAGAGQMFIAEGSGTSAQTGHKIYGTVKNTTMTYEGNNYIVRSTSSSDYAYIDLTFDGCTIQTYTTNATMTPFRISAKYADTAIRLLNGTTVNKGITAVGTVLNNDGINSKVELAVGAGYEFNCNNYYLYNSKDTTSCTLTLDSWDITDTLDDTLVFSTTAGTGVWYNLVASDFTLGLTDCYTSSALKTDVFNNIDISETTNADFSLKLYKTRLSSENYVFYNQTTSGTYSLELIDSEITTSASHVISNAVADSTLKLTVISTDLSSTYVSTASNGVVSTGYVLYVNNDSTLLADIYGGDLSAGNKVVFYTDTSNANNSVINIYGGSFTGVHYEGNKPGGVLDVRGVKTLTNIYGGSFSASYVNASCGVDANAKAQTSEIVMISAYGSSMNIYGGTFNYNNDNNTAQLLRHNYKNSVNSSLVVSPTVSGAEKTHLSVYGGTFITNQGAVVSAGTSQGDKCYGNVYIYGGVFVKTGSSGGGYSIIDHKNNKTNATTTSQIISDNNYNIYGGIWISPDNNIRAYKYASSSDAEYVTAAAVSGTLTSYTKGTLNKQAASITVSDAGITAASYATFGITDEVWALIKNYSYKELVCSDAEVSASNPSLVGNTYFQLKSNTPSDAALTDLRIIVEMKKLIADNPLYTEFGFFVTVNDNTALAGTRVDGSGIIYSAVLENGSSLWRPADASNAIALLDLKNVTNEYFTNAQNKIYVTTFVKSSSGILHYGKVAEIDITTACADQIDSESELLENADIRVLITSDMHYTHSTNYYSTSHDDRLQRWVDAINYEHTLRPFDLIVIAGDMSLDFWTNGGSYLTDGTNKTQEFMDKYVSQLPSDVPVFVLAGNHEQYGNEKWKQMTGNDRSGHLVIGNNVFIFADSFAGDLDPTTHHDGVQTSPDLDGQISSVMAQYPEHNVYLISHYFSLSKGGQTFKDIVSDDRVVGLYQGHTHKCTVEDLGADYGNKMLAHTGTFANVADSLRTDAQTEMDSLWGFRDILIDGKSVVSRYIVTENSLTLVSDKTLHDVPRHITNVVTYTAKY